MFEVENDLLVHKPNSHNPTVNALTRSESWGLGLLPGLGSVLNPKVSTDLDDVGDDEREDISKSYVENERLSQTEQFHLRC